MSELWASGLSSFWEKEGENREGTSSMIDFTKRSGENDSVNKEG
jgi:hypothetical protein